MAANRLSKRGVAFANWRPDLRGAHPGLPGCALDKKRGGATSVRDGPFHLDGAKAGVTDDDGAVHVPDVTLARDRVFPEDVGLAIAVEVQGGNDPPIKRGR